MISQRIRELRLGKKLTLQEVATHLGVTRASVSKWEQGHTNPEHSRLEQLAKLFGVPTTHLVSDTPGPPIKQLPVVDYGKYTKVDEFHHRLNRPDRAYFSTSCNVSDSAFYMHFVDREPKDIWQNGFQSGTLVLFDPALPHTTDDLIYAHDARGSCQLLYFKVKDGARCYRAFVGNKDLYHEGDYLVILGVAVESVLVTKLKR